MENHTYNSQQQWIPNPHHTQSKKKLEFKNQQQQQNLPTSKTQQNRKWIVFTYHSPLTRKVTNLFKQ